MIRKCLIAALLAALFGVITYGQFVGCSSGLLQMPTAELPPDGTVMITNNFVNKHSLSTKWDYNTFQYGVSISLWERIEIDYVCTIFNGAWITRPDITYRESITRNQDRHFGARVCILREGEFGTSWIPALVFGICDPVSGTTGEYLDTELLAIIDNGYFNRTYAVLTKHFNTTWGELGIHGGYQFNKRADYRINGPCVGLNWRPVWLIQKGVLDRLDFIAEYDSRTFNVGLITTLFNNHIEAMFELQNFQWINFGLRYKFCLKS